ncbi:hypothetical protein [Celeribacter persicus]|uniref:Uncharacterized protein n=1 Tax=Celeribacter persicus TaxID=1651082 RepID=A0A2T5H7I4_9RHOB|nr:hypothetical protein [Celeribacter persicus]PTQ67517.1 hypothetical protein C8N42_11810 [Celeribacter persicus]
MIVGLLFVSLLIAALTTTVGLGLGMPLWLGLAAFPMIGAAALLVLSALIYSLRAQTQNRNQFTPAEGEHLLA